MTDLTQPSSRVRLVFDTAAKIENRMRFEPLSPLQRRLAMTEEATEQPAPALAWDEIDVADEFRATLAPFQHYLAAVEGFKLGAMGDADHGGHGQLLGHQLHHLVLALFIECRGRFVQHDDIWLVQKQPREGKPLLFTS